MSGAPRQPAGMADTPWRSGSFAGGGAPDLLFGGMFEDAGIERAAFAGCQRIFCIASAGCTALALAADGHEVTAVDINARQVAYLEGRLAGAAQRDGRADRLLAAGRAVLAHLGWHEAERRRFLELADPARQRRWWRGRLGAGAFRAALLAGLHPLLLRTVYALPYLRALPGDFAGCILRRLERGFATHPNASNPFAWRLLLGHAAPGHAAPAPPAGPAPRLLHADAAAALEAEPPGAFDGFALSNIGDGAGGAYRRRLAAAVRRAAAPGARLVRRSFAEPPTADQAAWAVRDRALLWGAIEVGDARHCR